MTGLLSVSGIERVLATVEKEIVPIGGRHHWWNAGGEEAVVAVEIRPALETEVFFETLIDLARDGKTNGRGIPGLLQIAVTYAELGDSCSRGPRPPVALRRLILPSLAPIDRLLGRRAAGVQPGLAGQVTRSLMQGPSREVVISMR